MQSTVRTLWKNLSRVPGGGHLFGYLVGRLAPYSGSIAPVVVELRDGYARVEMRDRRGVRNHLHSVHAVALANLAELASGLALIHALPPDARAILVGLGMEYVKKARGRLTAEADFDPPSTSEQREYEFESTIRDAAGEVVARGRARWLVGPG